MTLGQIILLAVSSNLDDLGVGFSIGLKERVCNRFISVIALISAMTMMLGLFLGRQVSGFLSDHTASYISASVFILIGVWFVWQGVKSKNEEYEMKAILKKGMMKRAVVLGLVLGIDSITLGVSAGLVYYPIVLTSLFAGITSFVFILVGSRFGNKISVGFISDKSDFLAAILLFFLAIIHV